MRFLIDYHHSDLFESHFLLLEPLGIEIWRPIGMEWFHEGIWQFEKEWHGDAVAHQYLDIWDSDVDSGDVIYRDDVTHPGRTFRMVTLERARQMEWDGVISATATFLPLRSESW